MDELGCFSRISSSDDDPSISNSVPEDASGKDVCDIRFAAELVLLGKEISFSLMVGV